MVGLSAIFEGLPPRVRGVGEAEIRTCPFETLTPAGAGSG